MRKLATVQALSDSAGRPERLRATMDLQAQISTLTSQVEHLGKTLMRWAQASQDLSQQQRQQMLDLAVLIDPIVPALVAIQQKQQAQDARLAKLEVAITRVTTALPLPRQPKDGQAPVQPKLASRDELMGLPAKVWQAKPGMFTKP